MEQVEVEYVPEKAELYGDFDEEFRKAFEKFSFKGTVESEENEKKDETAANVASNKKADSDSEEEEQDAEQKEKGVSNKKKKLQRRMKIAELRQTSSRPDLVEVCNSDNQVYYSSNKKNRVDRPKNEEHKRVFKDIPSLKRVCHTYSDSVLSLGLICFQKSDRVDVTLQPEELELMDNVLPAKYEEAREEEKQRGQREDFSDMVAVNEKKRKWKMQEKEGKSKKKDFKF